MKNLMLLVGCVPLAFQVVEPVKPIVDISFVANGCRYENLCRYDCVDAIIDLNNSFKQQWLKHKLQSWIN